MKKLFFIIITSILITNCILSENLNKYQISLLKSIQIGSEEGQIGWDESTFSSGGVPGPSTFAISKDGKIFIPDIHNYRISVFDINFCYLYSFIDNEKMCAFADYIKFDEQGNLIVNLNYKGLKKIDPHGNTFFKVDGKYLPKTVKYYYDFFPVHNQIVYYNDKGEIEVLLENGKIKSNEEAWKIINNLRTQEEKIIKASNGRNNFHDFSDEIKKKVNNLHNDVKYLLIGDKFYSSDFNKNLNYFKLLKNEELKTIKTIKSNDVQKRDNDKVSEIEIDLDKYSMGFIGYDQDHNSYWGATEKKEVNGLRSQLIVVFSKYGDLLDAFHRGQYEGYAPNTETYQTSGAKVTVAPSGDIYFMVEPKAYYVPPTKEMEKRGIDGYWRTPETEAYTFYKIERQW